MGVERNDFWVHPEGQVYGMIPTGTRWGDWLFLSAQTPVDLDTGRMVLSPWELPSDGQDVALSGFEFMDGRFGPVKAQTWQIYSNLVRILGQQGSSLDDVVRQRIYLRDVSDSAAVEEVMLQFFPGDKPATKVQGMSGNGLQRELRIQVEMIALVTGTSLIKKVVSVPELDSITAPYPVAVTVGDLLFTSGIIGMNLKTGKAAMTLEELGADAVEVATGRVLTDATAEATKAQFWLTFRHIERILESQGAPLRNLLHVNCYTGGPWSGIAYTPLLRSSFFGGRADMPTVTGFLMQEMHVKAHVNAVTDAIALLPGGWKKESGIEAQQRVGVAPMWTKAGPFCFVSGDLAADPIRHKIVRAFADLDDAGRWLGDGGAHPFEGVTAQAWYVFRKLERAMEGVTSGLGSVVQQHIFLRDLTHYPAVERIARMVYRGAVPPTTVIPVDSIGPYDGLLIEIEIMSVAE